MAKLPDPSLWVFDYPVLLIVRSKSGKPLTNSASLMDPDIQTFAARDGNLKTLPAFDDEAAAQEFAEAQGVSDPVYMQLKNSEEFVGLLLEAQKKGFTHVSLNAKPGAKAESSHAIPDAIDILTPRGK